MLKDGVLQVIICLAARPLGNCSDGDLRLVSQSLESTGVLQICTNGTWFALCGALQTSAAAIACGQLGFDSGPFYSGKSPCNYPFSNFTQYHCFVHAGHSFTTSFNTEGTTAISANFNCIGNETNLSQCTTSGPVSVVNCSSFGFTALNCPGRLLAHLCYCSMRDRSL